MFVGALRQSVMVVGCGGTGGFLAEGLCRLLPRSWSLSLVDFDLVEEHNLLRQAFYPGDVGRFKSQVLAERLSRLFNRPVGFITGPFMRSAWAATSTLLGTPGLVLGCVDNALARTELSQAISVNLWWVDAGNDENWGQVLIGNSRADQLPGAFDGPLQTVYKLPLPTLQSPQLLLPELAPVGDPDCAELVIAGIQSATINQIMAATMLEVTRRLIAGTCPWMSLYLDLDLGVMRPVYATPEHAARISGVPEGRLMATREYRR
jgi:hypothetical protein